MLLHGTRRLFTPSLVQLTIIIIGPQYIFIQMARHNCLHFSQLEDQQVASPSYSLFWHQTWSFVPLFSLVPFLVQPDKYNNSIKTIKIQDTLHIF